MNITWKRETPTMISWTIVDEDGSNTYHANLYATFLGEPVGNNIYRHQVHGWAFSPQRDTIGATSRALRSIYPRAKSVRHVVA